MDIDKIEKLALKGHSDAVSSAIRLSAARIATCGETKKNFYAAAGISASNLSNMENAESLPSRKAMLWFYKNFGVDFNYFIVGEVRQLSYEFLSKLEPALEKESSRWEQKRTSNLSDEDAGGAS